MSEKTLKYTLALCFIVFFCELAFSQEQVLIHSHNDYRQKRPFFQAYNRQLYSIEVDVFASRKEGKLLVAHSKIGLIRARSFDELYLQPIVRIYKENEGRAWKNSDKKLQLMIELKGATEPALSYLVASLKAYPEVFDEAVNPFAVKLVVSGKIPSVKDFEKYPSFVFFDGRIEANYTKEQLQRIALISANFRKYASRNAKGIFKNDEKKRLRAAIDRVHTLGKPIRFWGISNSKAVWSSLYSMGVDIINTDKVEACSDFFKNYEEEKHRISDEEKKALNL